MDIENILFYNVGTTTFADMATKRLLFERKDALPPTPPHKLGFEPIAHTSYRVSGGMTLDHGVKLAECKPCQAGTFADAALLWKLFKTNVGCLDATIQPGEPFKIQLIVSAPETKRINLVSIMKRLPDGFISAFHCRNASDPDLTEVVVRLAANYKWNPDEVRSLLLDTKTAVLGARQVPRSYREKSVQWSPADHLLTSCEIRRELGDTLSIEGSLFRA